MEFFLAAVEIGRNGYNGFDDLIASAKPAQMGNSFSFQTEDLAGLGAPGNFQFFRSHQGRHLDIVSQGRLDEGNRNPADNVVIRALEEFMFFNMNEDI